MDIIGLQKAIGTKADGIWGQNSRNALLNSFTNKTAPGATAQQISRCAARLRVTAKQVRAVAKVESSGGGFDRSGRPKILYERHKFHKLTGGRWSVCVFSDPKSGGYGESSWDKLNGAIVTGAVDAAFMACSWGRFQVLGEYWDDFGYETPFAFAHATVEAEAAHYEMLCQYIEHFGLQDEMAALSTNADRCRPFAKAYNGSRYEALGYHTKLAAAMA